MEKEKVYFFTASILNWIPVLKTDGAKAIILDSLKFLVSEKVTKLYAFVIMPNHIHLVIKPLENEKSKIFS